jgi:TRAP-type C4-dicarboxylate transport system substrate-binding protein
MKQNVITRFGGVALAALTLFAGAAQAQTVLTMSSWLPPSHPLVSDLLVPFAAEVETATEGRVTVQILPAPLGPPPAAFDIAKNGIADITYGVQGYVQGRFNTAAMGEMPMLGDSAEAVSVGYWRVFDKYLRAAGEYDGVKVLSVFAHGPGALFTKGTELTEPEQIAGQKIRIGSTVAHTIVSALGAVPVEGPSSKAYELLSQGVADGILFPFESVEFFNLIPLLDHGFVVPGGLYNTSFFIVMNQAKFDGLSPQDQAAIDRISGEALARKTGQMWDRADAKGRAAMEGKITLHTADDAQVAILAETLAPVIEAQIASVTAAGVDGAAAYEMLKSEIAAEQAK